MEKIVLFDTAVLILLAGEVLFLLRKPWHKLYEVTALITILIYRVTTWIGLTLGLSFEALGTSQWRYDHKWLGLTIVMLILLFWPKKRATRLRTVLLGVGTGQIIDEVSEFLMILGLPIPLTFRDTLPDFLLIMSCFGLFVLTTRAIRSGSGKYLGNDRFR